MSKKKTNSSEKRGNQVPVPVMKKIREIIPVISQATDPLGSYTGTPAGNPSEKPVQDADDL